MERFSREDMARNREEMRYSLRDFNESLLNRMDESAARSIQKLDRIDETVDLHLKTLQEDNSRRLEQIRATVDDRLQDTLWVKFTNDEEPFTASCDLEPW